MRFRGWSTGRTGAGAAVGSDAAGSTPADRAAIGRPAGVGKRGLTKRDARVTELVPILRGARMDALLPDALGKNLGRLLDRERAGGAARGEFLGDHVHRRVAGGLRLIVLAAVAERDELVLGEVVEDDRPGINELFEVLVAEVVELVGEAVRDEDPGIEELLERLGVEFPSREGGSGGAR